MQTIYKYLLKRTLGKQEISMPDLSRVVSAGLDGEENLAIWAEVNTKMPMVTRKFYVVWTGVDLDAMLRSYMKVLHHGTIVDKDSLVYHIYEVGNEIN